jgi:hypothetical protein
MFTRPGKQNLLEQPFDIRFLLHIDLTQDRRLERMVLIMAYEI